MSSKDRENRGGGKFPNRERGMALSEFEDEYGSARRSNRPVEAPVSLDEARARRAERKAPPFPMGVAGIVGLGALVVASSLLFFWRRGSRREEPDRTDFD